MSFDKFQSYLTNLLSHPSNTQTDYFEEALQSPNKPSTYFWIPTDSEQWWNLNSKNSFKERKNKLRDNITEEDFNFTLEYYLKNPIKYKLNEYNLRSDKFSTSEGGNVFLGCSDTFGIGQHFEHTWPYILTKLKFPNNKIYNMAVPGSGSDTAFRLLSVLKNKCKIKNIFHWLPFRNRFEIYMGNDSKSTKIGNIKMGDIYKPAGFSTIVPQFEIDNNIFSKEYIKYGLSTETSRNINDLKNILAIKQIADDLNINYYISNNELGYHSPSIRKQVMKYYEKNIPSNLHARDFKHMKPEETSSVVSKFIELLENKLL